MLAKISRNNKIIGLLLIVGNIGSIVSMSKSLFFNVGQMLGQLFETIAPLLLAIYYLTYTGTRKHHILYIISFALLALFGFSNFYYSYYMRSYDQALFCIFCIIMIVVKFKSSITLSSITAVLLLGATLLMPTRHILLKQWTPFDIHPFYTISSLIEYFVFFLVWNFERIVMKEKRKVKEFEGKLVDINKAYQAGLLSEEDYLKQKSAILSNL